jgi:hypothetical protein
MGLEPVGSHVMLRDEHLHWKRLIATRPFEGIDNPSQTQYAVILYYDPCEKVKVGLQQSGNALFIPHLGESLKSV